jgi:hypothetical protein
VQTLKFELNDTDIVFVSKHACVLSNLKGTAFNTLSINAYYIDVLVIDLKTISEDLSNYLSAYMMRGLASEWAKLKCGG